MEPLVAVRSIKSLIPLIVPILAVLGIDITPELLNRLVEWLGAGYGLLTAFEAIYQQWKNKTGEATPCSQK